MTEHKNIGNNFDDFLAVEGELDEVTTVATERVIAWQLGQAIQEAGVTKSAASRMHTSRTVVGLVFDPSDSSLTLDTMTRAANALV